MGVPVIAKPAPPADPIAAYAAALDKLPPMGNVVFTYSETRTGPTRTLVEDHRVYRSADGNERNETTAVNGTPVTPVIVRIATKPVWPYDVRRFAVGPDAYNILPLGLSKVAGKRVTTFSTVRTSAGDFSITGLYLDPVRFLPVRETFQVAGSGCTGNGSIDFGQVGARWLASAATVTCAIGQGGATFKESIRFSSYQFLKVLPPDIFGVAK